MKWTLEALEILARNEYVPGIALRDALSEIKKLRKEKEMSKTVKFDFTSKDSIVSLEDVEKLTPDQVDDALRGFGYDPEQVKLHGKVFMKVLFENLELRRQIAELEKRLAAKNG